MISAECEANGLDPHELKRMWLHQANLSMNHLIAKKVLGKEVDLDKAPVVLDEYANTSSAGSIIAFHKHSSDFKDGDTGLICSFGAGYTAGAIFVRRVAWCHSDVTQCVTRNPCLGLEHKIQCHFFR